MAKKIPFLGLSKIFETRAFYRVERVFDFRGFFQIHEMFRRREPRSNFGFRIERREEFIVENRHAET